MNERKTIIFENTLKNHNIKSPNELVKKLNEMENDKNVIRGLQKAVKERDEIISKNTDNLSKLKKSSKVAKNQLEKTKTSSLNDKLKLVEIVGQKDQRIAELEEEKMWVASDNDFLKSERNNLERSLEEACDRIAELEEENKQLKAEPEKVWNDNLQEIKNDIVDKFIEQIHKEYRKEFNRRLEEKTKSIKDDFENQRRLLMESYNNKIDELQEQCDRHLKSRVELIKQITGLQEENAKLKEQIKTNRDFYKLCVEKCNYESLIINDFRENNGYAGWDIKDILGEIPKQSAKIDKLQEQLKNSIVPKFNVGQEVWYYHIGRYKTYSGVIEDIKWFARNGWIYYRLPNLQRDDFWIREDELFYTEAEAQKYLEERK